MKSDASHTTEAAADGRLQGIAECLAYVKGVEVPCMQDELSLRQHVEMTLEIVADGIRDLYAAARGG